MHSGHKRFLTAALAALMSAVMLSAPVSAIAEEAELTDRNHDGVIDVFDYVLSKRVSVAENSPLDLSLGDAVGAPGSLVAVPAVLNQNPGFTSVKLSVSYDADLIPEITDDRETSVIVNEQAFPKLDLSVFMLKKLYQIICCTSRSFYSEEDGTICDFIFRIPDDAEPGTVYTVCYQDAELLDKNNSRLPLLTKRGKITVVAPEDLPEPPLSEPAVTTATTAAASGTTTLTEAQTVAPPATATSAATTAKQTKAASSKTTTTVTTTVTTTAETTTTVRTAPPYLWKGIDVSQYQGDINFRKVRDESENKYVMMRAGYGRFADQEDPTFRTNYSRAKAVGMPVGVYWYSYAKTPEVAKIEAHVCAQVLGDRQFEYPIAFDIEEPDVLSKSVEEISAIIEAFCSEMERMGYYSMLYCSSYYLNNRISKSTLAKYSIWVANYNVECPSFTGEYGMWQYGIGRSAGIDYDVDVNYCYKDYPSIIKTYHLNKF